MKRLTIAALAAALLTLSLSAGAVEIGPLHKASAHGIGFRSGAGREFALQATAMWGGYQDQAPRAFYGGLGDALTPHPIRGYWRERWQLASPYGDNWSARFTGTLKVETAGDYTLYFQSDDGCRVWVDDTQVIDDWVPRSNLTSEATLNLAAGDHAVRCEYLEIGGQAQAHFRWKGPGLDEQVMPKEAVPGGWQAEYFLNRDLQGEPTVGREEVIDVDWGDGGPAVFGAGPPIVTLHWARITDSAIVGHLRCPESAHAGLLLQTPAGPSLGYSVWGPDLVALSTSPDGALPIEFRIRALSEGAAYSVQAPGAAPAVWVPGGGPSLFLAGFGDLPDLSADEAASALIAALASGTNSTFPPLADDGWAHLFSGENLDGWALRHPEGKQSWSVENGELVSEGHGTDLYDATPLTDCRLHIEFNVPEGSNSGVYLQGRYEVQVHDSFGEELKPWSCAGLYNQALPTVNACKPPGEWQTLDIEFRSARPSLDGGLASPARATVVHNGIKVIDDFPLTGPTGGEMDGEEGMARGIMLQGDHGAVRYRNIKVQPIK